MTPQNAHKLKALCELATSSEGEASEKWEANSKVMTYLRQNLNVVADLIVAAVNVSSRPGGINHTRLHEAVAALPKIGGKK